MKKIGGYNFSDAQLEVLDGIPPQKIEEIGKIMSMDESGSKLKQKIFNNLGVDGFFVVELRFATEFPDIEKRVMRDYFLSCDRFETAEEIYQFFDSSEYLKKHPDMKKEIVGIALSYL